MKHIYFVLLLAVVFNSISIEDTKDPQKVLLSIHYDNHPDDRVIVDRKKLKSDDLARVVGDIVEMRTNRPTGRGR